MKGRTINMIIHIDEQETVINIDPRSKCAEIYSCVPRTILKLEKLVNDNNSECVITHRDNCGIIIEVPSNWIKIKPPTKRFLTDEQREEIRQRLQKSKNK